MALWPRSCFSFEATADISSETEIGGVFLFLIWKSWLLQIWKEARIWLGRTLGISSSCFSSPVQKGDQCLAMCAFPGDGLFSWGNSPLCLATDCSLSALPCASPAFLSEPFRASGGKRKAPEQVLWGGRVLTSPDAHSISGEVSVKVSVGPTLADFLIYMSVDYSNRIMCLKKDYLAGSCLPNISLEQVFTAEIQWPDSNVCDRNSASCLMPATHWPLSHWETLLSKWPFLLQMAICLGNISWCF